MTDSEFTHSEVTYTLDGQGEAPTYTAEQIADFKITPEELEAVGQNDTDVEESSGKILGKFNSQEDLEKAYQELEKKYHEPTNSESQVAPLESSQDDSQQVSEDSLVEGEQPLADADATETPVAAGTDIGEAFKSLEKAGGLNDEIVQQFEAAGVPEGIVQRMQELETFKADADLKSIQSDVGGSEAYSGMVDWARNNLSQQEITTFDNIVTNGTIDEIKFAVTNLNGRMSNVTQTRHSKLIKADVTSSPAEGYKTQAHMISDMSDPRYDADPSFRDKVIEKAGKSNW